MGKEAPLRSCIGCREVREKRDLVRFVLSPSGDVVLDYNSKLPGRGCYLCPDSGCIEKALKQRAFNRSFRCSVKVGTAEEFREKIAGRAKEKVLSFLSLAVKSGNIFIGTSAVEDGIRNANISLLLLAGGISDRARAKWMNESGRKGIALMEITEVKGAVSIAGGSKVLGVSDRGMSLAIMRELDRIGKLRPGL